MNKHSSLFEPFVSYEENLLSTSVCGVNVINIFFFESDDLVNRACVCLSAKSNISLLGLGMYLKRSDSA